MQTTVESMMVAQAEESMQKFLAWAKQRCVEFKQVWSLQTHALYTLDWHVVSELGCLVSKLLSSTFCLWLELPALNNKPFWLKSKAPVKT